VIQVCVATLHAILQLVQLSSLYFFSALDVTQPIARDKTWVEGGRPRNERHLLNTDLNIGQFYS